MSRSLGEAAADAFVRATGRRRARGSSRSSGQGFARGLAEGQRVAMLLEQTWSYALAHQADLWLAVRQHVALCAAALAIAAVSCVPLGIWTSHARRGGAVVAAVTAARVVPSLAVLAFMLPIAGVGFRSALLALVLLACPPILINTDVAFRDIQPFIRESAAAMGMRPAQALARVEYPLALPVMLTGVRTSTIEVIASATLAAFIGGGGLGTFILDGLANNDMRQLLLGGACVAALALAAEAILGLVGRAAAWRYWGSAAIGGSAAVRSAARG